MCREHGTQRKVNAKMSKYAIKIPFGDDEDDKLFVTEGDTKFMLRIKTFDTAEEARDYASVWQGAADVVELDDDFEIVL